MSSDGLSKKAKKGKCHICFRVRPTDSKVQAVGEVRHGYATGHIWECIDAEECEQKAKEKIARKAPKYRLIEIALKQGRAKVYIYKS